MVHLLASWLMLAVVVWLTAAVVPGIEVRGAGGALVTAAVFGILNALIGWFIFAVLGIASLGLGFLLAFVTRWVVNALLLLMTSKLTDKLVVRGFGSAFLGALAMSAIGTLLELMLRRWT